jgi:hypothetical protein
VNTIVVNRNSASVIGINANESEVRTERSPDTKTVASERRAPTSIKIQLAIILIQTHGQPNKKQPHIPELAPKSGDRFATVSNIDSRMDYPAS